MGDQHLFAIRDSPSGCTSSTDLSLAPSSCPSAFCWACCRLSLWHTSKAWPMVRTIRIACVCKRADPWQCLSHHTVAVAFTRPQCHKHFANQLETAILHRKICILFSNVIKRVNTFPGLGKKTSKSIEFNYSKTVSAVVCKQCLF